MATERGHRLHTHAQSLPEVGREAIEPSRILAVAARRRHAVRRPGRVLDLLQLDR